MLRTFERFYGEELLASRPTPKLEEKTLLGCPRLLIQYIRSYTPHLEAVHPYATRERDKLWRPGTHLSWGRNINSYSIKLERLC